MIGLEKEESLWQAGYHYVAGVDEAGRGPLAGPVVAACVVLGPDFPKDDPELSKIRDSKKLSAKTREYLFSIIKERAAAVEISVISHEVIDRINILQASLLAMQRAVKASKIKPDYVLVDGQNKIPRLDIPQEAIIGGDDTILAIAAASIIAKVSRDYLLNEYDQKYPQYGFKQHKGYGTKQHLAAIKEFGPCPIHRLTFAPLAAPKKNKSPYFKKRPQSF